MAYHVFNQLDAETIGSESDIITNFSGEQYFLADTPFGYKGLYVKLSYNNRGSGVGNLKRQWYFRYSVGGKQRKHPLGDVRMMDYNEACREHALLAKRVQEGEDVVAKFKEARAKAAAKPDTVLFEKVAADWLDDRDKDLKISSNTWRQDRSRVDKHLVPFFKNRTVDTITSRDVIALRNKVFTKTPAMSTKLLSLMRQILNFAFEHNLCDRNVAKDVEAKYTNKRREAWFRDADIKRIFERLEQDDIPANVQRCVQLLALTGLRRQNVISLKKSQVLMMTGGGAVLNFSSEEMKMGIPFKVFIDAETVEKVLEPAIVDSGNSDYVFPATRRANCPHISPVNVSQYMKVVLDSLGVDGVLHTWRSSLISGVQELGVDLAIADSLLAHSPPGTAAIYSKSWQYPKMAKAWMVWQGHVWSLVSGRSSVVSDDDKVRQLFQ